MTHLIAGLVATAPPAVTGNASLPDSRNSAAPANGTSFKEALHAAQDERPPEAQPPADPPQDDIPTEAELAALAALLPPVMAPTPELMVDTTTLADAALTATEDAAPQMGAPQANALAQTIAAPAAETVETPFVLPEAEPQDAPMLTPTQLTPTPPTQTSVKPEELDAKAATDRPPLQRAAASSDPPLGPPFSVMVTERVITTPFNELARLSETRPAEVLPQIQRGVESLVHSGQTSLRLQLHPDHLGRIDLQLTASANGVRVSLVADQSHTSQLLERHLADLRQTLADSGITIAGMSVGLSAQQGQAFNLANWQPPAPGGLLGGSTLAVDSAPEAETTQHTPRLDVGFLVDYSI